MKEAERHAGTLLFFTVLRAKMQFSYFEHVRRPIIAFSYMHISHYFSVHRSRSTILVGSNKRFPLTFSVKLIMHAVITVVCLIKSFSPGDL